MSNGWDATKVSLFKEAFSDFLKHVKIASKDREGYHPLQLYNSQKRFLREVFLGLEEDKHWFVVLKARQLGLSTIVRALLVFWAFMHKGLRVALVYDTDKNKEAARTEITQFLDRLPKSHRIPVKHHPKTHLELENGSVITYLVAGIKKSKSSGGLGRSLGVNCCGATEMSSWADIEGLRAFERSLSQKFENRLYVWESTARGFNIFYDLWEEAKADDITKKAIFIGWWAKEDYSIPRDTPLFDRYGTAPPAVEEQAQIDKVRIRYGHEITMEQLAWYRHEYDPNSGGDDREHAGQEIVRQELPWIEEEAFLLSGSLFFSGEKLTTAIKNSTKFTPKGFRYFTSEEFTATKIEPAQILRQAQLKIWEDPEPGGIYVIGADPAFGSSEKGDRHCAQVLRCYADGLDQVAEFCTTEIIDYQFAWVLAHLCGAYDNARLLIELNGPGSSVWNEFRMLNTILTQGYLRDTAEEKGLTNIFANVKQYLYARQDSLARNPTAFQWETSAKRKVQIMTRLRDFFHLGQLKIRSNEALLEMRKIVRDGDSIEGEGAAKDDRVMGLALAVRAWEDSERKVLISQNRTRENEAKRKDFSQRDLQEIFSTGLVEGFFNQQRNDRIKARRIARRGSRWNW